MRSVIKEKKLKTLKLDHLRCVNCIQAGKNLPSKSWLSVGDSKHPLLSYAAIYEKTVKTESSQNHERLYFAPVREGATLL